MKLRLPALSIDNEIDALNALCALALDNLKRYSSTQKVLDSKAVGQ
jgi:hypothetical protein